MNKQTYSLFILKPGFLAKKKEFLKICEENKINIDAKDETILNRGKVETHYEEHYGKSFYDCLVEYMSTGDVKGIHKFDPKCIVMVVSSGIANETEEEFIIRSRQVVKEQLRPILALKRADYAHLSDEDFKELSITANGVHASDSPASAIREINNLMPSFASASERE